MIKGIIALFRSKAIFNPKTLFGIMFGCYLWSNVEATKDTFNAMGDVNTYIEIMLFVIVGKLLFLTKYKQGKHNRINWVNFFTDSMITLLHVVAVVFLTLSFGLSMSIGN